MRLGWSDAAPAAIFLLAAAVIAVVLPDAGVSLDPRPGVPALPEVLLIAAVAAVGELLRRTRPAVGLLIAVGAVALGFAWHAVAPLGVVIMFVDLMMTTITNARSRISTGVTLVALLVVAAATTFQFVTGGGREGLQTLLNLTLIIVAPVGWASEVRRHRKDAEYEHERAEAERVKAEEERERAEQAERMAELSRQAAIADERARMARDLHDVIAGHLSAIALQSAAVLSLADADPVATRRVLESVRRNSVASLTEMRTMIELLRSSTDDAAPPDPTTAPARLSQLSELVDSARASGLTVATDVDVPDDVAAAVDLAAYRIVQESLTNAAKHAPGSAVRLSVRRREGELVIDVVNTPAGPGNGSGAGTGLLGLRERALAVGGDVEAGPCDGGWRVRTVLPVAGPAERADSASARCGS